VNRWLSADQRYDRPRGLTGLAKRPALKWIGLLVAWVIVSGVLSNAHLGVLLLVTTAGLICYCAYCIIRDTPRARQQTAGQWGSEQVADGQGREQFNPPPGWPEPPPDWEPPPGWKPSRSWPPAPPGWQFWVRPDNGRGVERTGRSHRNGRSQSESVRSWRRQWP